MHLSRNDFFFANKVEFALLSTFTFITYKYDLAWLQSLRHPAKNN